MKVRRKWITLIAGRSTTWSQKFLPRSGSDDTTYQVPNLLLQNSCLSLFHESIYCTSCLFLRQFTEITVYGKIHPLLFICALPTMKNTVSLLKLLKNERMAQFFVLCVKLKHLLFSLFTVSKRM